MDNDYSWTKFNPAAAQKLCAYSDRREELLSWLYSALPEETNYLHDPDHKKLTDIDPFTVFGVMNRHISQEKKAEVAKAFKIFFKVDEPSPTDFRGVSPLNNENSMFFGFKDGKTKEDINNLWTLFLGIFGQNNEVVNRRVPLQQKGASAWACCPFHNEKSPSFSVNRERGFYHCFGCGEHGNAISFLMKYENLPFVDAVEKLASEFSMQVRYEGGAPKPKSGKPRLSEIMQRAMEFYRDKFNSDKFSQDYLHDRGLKNETIERFGIGFSPDAWHNLDAVFTPDLKPLLLEAGLQRTGQSGNVYDFFRNRLMFPIRNIRGQVIAFSARTMIGEEPKYINTGDTPIFTKGSEVFGLYEARKSIQDKKRVIVVEGQMDVIQLSQAGFGEACAPLGTAIRAEHIERLLKMTDHVIFSFDGDAAGRKAAKRAMDLSLPLLDDAQKVSFVFLPEGEDPDSLVKKSGALAFEEMLKKALPLSSYLIEALSQGLDLAVLEDRNAFIEEASPLVRKTKSALLRDGLIERLSTAVGYKNSDELRKYFGFPVLPPAAPQRINGFGNQRYGFGRSISAAWAPCPFPTKK